MTSIQELEQRIEKNPRSLLFARLADSYLKEGRIDEAVEVCIKGLQHCPSYTTGHYILAKAYLARGETDKAETALKKVVSHDRHYLSAHKHLGDIMARAGWESKAAVHYRDLLTIDPLEREAGEMLRSFSIDEPLRETGFHETVPSRSAEELRIEEKTTGINRKDWEEEFDELFRETKTSSAAAEAEAEAETEQIETEPQKTAASFNFDDDLDGGLNDDLDEGTSGSAAEPDAPHTEDSGSTQAPPAEPPEEYIDIEAFRPPPKQPAADSAADIELDDQDFEDLDVPADTADTGLASPADSEIPESSDSILLDVSLDDLDDIEDMDMSASPADAEKPPDIPEDLEDMDLDASPEDIEDMDMGAFPEDAEKSSKKEAGADITADSAFDDLDDSAFDKLDELFSREDALPAGSSTTESIGTSLFEKEAPAGDGIKTGPDGSGLSGSEEQPVKDAAEPSGIPVTESGDTEPAADSAAGGDTNDEEDPSELIAEINPSDFDDDLPLIADEPEEEPSEDAPDRETTHASNEEPDTDADFDFSKSETAPETAPGPAVDGSGGKDTEQKIVSPTLGEIYAAQGQYAKALKVFETLHAKNPDNKLYSRKIHEMNSKLAEE